MSEFKNSLNRKIRLIYKEYQETGILNTQLPDSQIQGLYNVFMKSVEEGEIEKRYATDFLCFLADDNPVEYLSAVYTVDHVGIIGKGYRAFAEMIDELVEIEVQNYEEDAESM